MLKPAFASLSFSIVFVATAVPLHAETVAEIERALASSGGQDWTYHRTRVRRVTRIAGAPVCTKPEKWRFQPGGKVSVGKCVEGK